MEGRAEEGEEKKEITEKVEFMTEMEDRGREEDGEENEAEKL